MFAVVIPGAFRFFYGPFREKDSRSCPFHSHAFKSSLGAPLLTHLVQESGPIYSLDGLVLTGVDICIV